LDSLHSLGATIARRAVHHRRRSAPAVTGWIGSSCWRWQSSCWSFSS